MTDPTIALLVLLLPPLVQILIMVAARVAVQSSDSTQTTVELDCLLALKRLGTLNRQPAKIPDEMARSKPFIESRKPAEIRAVPFDDGLEHLVQLKRRRDEGAGPHAFSKGSPPLPRSSSAIQTRGRCEGYSEWGD